MTVVGFNFTKINVEKNAGAKGKLTISNNFGVKEVSDAKLAIGGDKAKPVKFEFTFESKYEPDYATIHLEGDLLFMFPTEVADKILKEWKDSKKLNNEIVEPVMNAILSKSNIEALILSKEMNLPSPVPLPKVNVKAKK
jgi:hypothetical protein